VAWLREYVVSYDPVADAVYIRIREGRVAESDEVAEGVIVDYDENGNIVGIEILEFSKRRVDLNELITKGPRVVVAIS